MTGKTVSHFRVLDKLGAGGMGEVYRAQDTNLDRLVALKVLPAHALASEDDRARFYREARAAAALNHANIGHVYEIDEAVLETGETHPFIAMEFVDGESLAERIRRGPLSLSDVIRIGSQIASGLAAAHAKDIVHRDIKPGNVMLTRADEAKILDFGLAKTAASTKLTQMGSTLGTFAYMSPEQARGEEVDARTDIWSLGAVLYEMITGRVPFPGEYEQAVVFGILNQDPEPPTAVRTGVPMELERIVTKCLSKDARQRYQHVDEVALDVGAVHIATTNMTGSATSMARRTARKESGIRTALWWVLAGAIIGTVVAGFVLKNISGRTSSASEGESVRRWNLVLSEDLPLAPISEPWYGASQPYLALSPDGSTLAYVAENGQLVIRHLDTYESTAVEGAGGVSFPFFSPDGEWIGFFSEGKLKKVRVSGGGPVTLCDARGQVFGGAWSNDGKIFFAGAAGNVLGVVDSDGGEPIILARANDLASSFSWPHILPNGQVAVSDWGAGSVAIFSAETGEVLSRIAHAATPIYSATGHLMFSRGGQLMAAPFDARTLDIGSAVPMMNWGGTMSGAYTLSASGTLVYDPNPSALLSELVWVDRTGAVSETSFDPQSFGMYHLSPDARRVAVRVFDTRWDLWVYDFDNGQRRRLTRQGHNHYPVWTPDGRWITYASEDDGKWSIYSLLASGLGERERLLESDARISPFSWSPDGTLLAFYDQRGMSILSLDRDTTQHVFAAGGHAAFSPDGRFIAYQSWDGNLYVESYPQSSARWLISSLPGGSESPRWSRDGHELLFRSRRQWYAVSVELTPDFRAGSPHLLFEGDYMNMSGRAFDATPTGERFLLLRRAEQEFPHRQLNVVTNWFSELERLAPTGN